MSDIPCVIVDATCKIPDSHKPERSGSGKAVCRVLIIDTDGQEYEYSSYLGEMTVSQAEFEGLIFALDKVAALTRQARGLDAIRISKSGWTASLL